MKKLLIILPALLLGCSKSNNVAPTPTTPPNTKVWCFYQTNYGNKAFYYCAKSEQEYNAKYNECITNGLSIAIEIKSQCSQCQ